MKGWKIEPYDRNSYHVTSPNSNNSYLVDVETGDPSAPYFCGCHDYNERGNKLCKHLKFTLEHLNIKIPNTEPTMIALKIDCTKITKSRLFQGKNGAKYLDCVLIDHPGEHSDGFISESVSQEERKAGVKGVIVGNWKHLGAKPNAKPAGKPAKRPPTDPDLESGEDSDPVPF